MALQRPDTELENQLEARQINSCSLRNCNTRGRIAETSVKRTHAWPRSSLGARRHLHFQMEQLGRLVVNNVRARLSVIRSLLFDLPWGTSAGSKSRSKQAVFPIDLGAGNRNVYFYAGPLAVGTGQAAGGISSYHHSLPARPGQAKDSQGRLGDHYAFIKTTSPNNAGQVFRMTLSQITASGNLLVCLSANA